LLDRQTGSVRARFFACRHHRLETKRLPEPATSLLTLRKS
jgi:hypothetical protein